MHPPALGLLLVLVAGCSAGAPSGSGAAPQAPPPSAAAPSAGPEPVPTEGGVPVPPGAQEATVVRQVDGDTVVLRGRGSGPLPPRPTKVRVLLVDTPEVFGGVECYGREASARFAALAPDGALVRVQADRDLTDRYDRVLLHLWADGVNVGEALLREGFASVLVVPPNRLHAEAFTAAERAARQAGRGRWSACPP